MNDQANIYYQNIASQPEQVRQTLLLALLSKLALVLFIGLIYAAIRFMG